MNKLMDTTPDRNRLLNVILAKFNGVNTLYALNIHFNPIEKVAPKNQFLWLIEHELVMYFQIQCY